ncbi:DMT family transporter [bacterium]|jgi:drug/metabolite transporter (DMT)-like permease|nr:DMT family transporter [bacterium]
MSIPWYLAAIGAAIIWGIHYPLIDFAMKRLSVYSVLLISVLPVLFLMPVFLRDLARDVDVFRLLPTNEQWLVAAIGLTSTLGAVLLYLSVNSKNATLASLIEITYPVFVVLFAYLFFRQVHVNTSVILGGLMILVGAGLVIYNNQ